MEKPVVGIVMGSDSDLPVMSKAAATCRKLRRFWKNSESRMR